MDLSTYNKTLYKQCSRAFKFAFCSVSKQENDNEDCFCHDSDTVRYRVTAHEELVLLKFTVIDINVLWAHIQVYFRSVYYRGFQISLQGEWLEITIDKTAFQGFAKTLNEQGQGNGNRRVDMIIDILSKKLASIKRHFMSSPFEMILQAVESNHREKGNRKVNNLCYFTKQEQKEKVWIAFEGNQFTVYYGLSFDDRFQNQLAKIYLSELVDTKKHVNNSPSIVVNQSELPKFLIQSFPQQRNLRYSFSNGIVSVTLYGSLVKNYRSLASYLANFRHYAHYHIQATKCYLHQRVLRRINILGKQLTHAQLVAPTEK